MVRIRVTCAVSGPSFSPAAAERTTGLAFQWKSEPGEQSPIERPAPRGQLHGRAELVIQEYGELADLSTRNTAALMALGRSIESLRRAGATALGLRVDVEYAGECRFELPADLLRRLADLGIPLAIACFARDETEELGAGRSLF